MQARSATNVPRLPTRWHNRLFSVLYDRLQRTLRERSHAGPAPFFDPGRFAWSETLERSHSAIRAEVNRLFARPGTLPPLHEISVEQKPLGDDDRWKAFFLLASGHHFPESMALCPETTKAVLSIPGVHNAFFSVLMPGRTIPLHRGPFCGCIRAHLAVNVPEPENCGIYVRSQEAQWQEGKVLLLDDSYIHMAWNRGTRPRIVLIVDVVREMPWPWRFVNAAVLGMIGRSRPSARLIGRYKAWERAFTRQS
jgi:beta-hydroxylase